MKQRIAAGLFAALMIVLAGCNDLPPVNSELHTTYPTEAVLESTQAVAQDKNPDDIIDLAEDTATEDPPVKSCPDDAVVPYNDFSVTLLKNNLQKGKSTLISPLSVLSALGMAANGADGVTLTELETAFGMSAEELNILMAYFRNRQADARAEINNANSIWLSKNKGFTPNQTFLKKAAQHYGAQVYAERFDDSTAEKINHWVSNNTNGKIKSIIDDLDPASVAVLVNALYFKAKWEQPYIEYDNTTERSFTLEDGTNVKKTMLTCKENGHIYLSDKNAEGFIKPYEGQKYAFAALLPKKGMRLSEYIDTLTGEALTETLKNAAEYKVRSYLPKFKSECSFLLNDSMKRMGVNTAFNQNTADFSRLGKLDNDYNIFISKILHKTFISVAEEGTEAAAVTGIGTVGSASPHSETVKTITLDRPFVYMVIDLENSTPLFMGTYMGN